MASYQALKTALELVSTGDPEAVKTDEFRMDDLSSQQMRQLNTQLAARDEWALGEEQNTVGLGISEKRVAAESTEELALTFYVKKKYPLASLDRSQIIPPVLELEAVNEPAPTDVREVGELRLEALTATKRPVICGYSIGLAEEGYTGTLGCMVRKRGIDDGNRLLLSNSHVLAKSGFGQAGDPVYQPGLDDDLDRDPIAVATLESWQPFKLGDAADNRVDAAIAEPVDQGLFDPSIYDIGRPRGVRVPRRGMWVQKSGRTTGHTYGRIEDVDFSTSIPYSRPDGGEYFRVNFSDLVACTRYTAGGDSGALVLDLDRYAVGLHFCGAQAVSIFSPIQHVLDELDIDLVT